MKKFIQNQRQKYYWMGLMSALGIVGAIASSGGYVVAQTPTRKLPCIPSATKPCTNPVPPNPLRKDPPQMPARAMSPELLQEILGSYSNEINQLTQKDPYAVQKLKLGDRETLKRFLKLAPKSPTSIKKFKTYLDEIQLQPAQLDQPATLQQSP
jgi:hypothetical protein